MQPHYVHDTPPSPPASMGSSQQSRPIHDTPPSSPACPSPPRTRLRGGSHSPIPSDQTQQVSIPVEASPFTQPTFERYVGPSTILDKEATAANFFELIFTNDIIEGICEQTNLSATVGPHCPGYRSWEPCTPEKVKSFLGLVIMMGLK